MNLHSHHIRHMEEKRDECEQEIPNNQEIISREVVTQKKYLSPYDVPGVYKTKSEMDRAVRRGDFNIAKTMHMAPNGDFYFLAFDNNGTKTKGKGGGTAYPENPPESVLSHVRSQSSGTAVRANQPGAVLGKGSGTALLENPPALQPGENEPENGDARFL